MSRIEAFLVDIFLVAVEIYSSNLIALISCLEVVLLSRIRLKHKQSQYNSLWGNCWILILAEEGIESNFQKYRCWSLIYRLLYSKDNIISERFYISYACELVCHMAREYTLHFHSPSCFLRNDSDKSTNWCSLADLVSDRMASDLLYS